MLTHADTCWHMLACFFLGVDAYILLGSHKYGAIFVSDSRVKRRIEGTLRTKVLVFWCHFVLIILGLPLDLAIETFTYGSYGTMGAFMWTNAHTTLTKILWKTFNGVRMKTM